MKARLKVGDQTKHYPDGDIIGTRVQLLHAILREPKNYRDNHTVLTGLKTQGGFAKLNAEDWGIFSVSLNTLKARAEREAPGGFVELDRLRRQARDKLLSPDDNKSAVATKFATKSYLKRRLQDTEQECQHLNEELALLTLCLRRSLDLWRLHVDQLGSDLQKELCKKEQAEILSFFSHSTSTATGQQKLSNVHNLKTG